MANPVEEFLKVAAQPLPAGFMDRFRAGWGGARSGGLGGALGEKLPAALVGAGVAGVGLGIAKGFNFIMDRVTKARDYREMLRATPDLKNFDAGHTQMMYNSLRSLAPTLSKDPLVSGSFVRDMLRLSPEHGPAIPPATAKMLMEAQGRVEGEGILPQMTQAAIAAKPSTRMEERDPQMGQLQKSWETRAGVRHQISAPITPEEALRAGAGARAYAKPLGSTELRREYAPAVGKKGKRGYQPQQLLKIHETTRRPV